MDKVAIVCGWAEGPWQTKPMRRLLAEKGYEVVKDPEKADIIIAHSAGCYAELDRYQAKQILLIGPPMWPGRTLPGSTARKLKDDLYTTYSGRCWSWLNKILHNWWYTLTTPKASYEAFRLMPKKLPHAKPGQRIVLIRNRLDTFCHPKVAEFIAKDRGYKYKQMNGGHDDCWTRPQRYVDLLIKF